MKQRLQFCHVAGSMKPAEAVTVSRPSKYGSPFKHQNGEIYIDARYRRKTLSRWVWFCAGDAELAAALYFSLYRWSAEQLLTFLATEGVRSSCSPVYLQDWIHHRRKFERVRPGGLKGRDLVTRCPLDTPSEAETLLVLAENPAATWDQVRGLFPHLFDLKKKSA